MASLADLDENARRCIMLLLPVPDLLRLSATSRGHRAELFRLMHGVLAVRLSFRLPGDGALATEREASFRDFLRAGGALLVKALELHLPVSPQVEVPAAHASSGEPGDVLPSK